MANDNNYSNELAHDRDPTSELETPTWRREDDIVVTSDTLEAQADTLEAQVGTLDHEHQAKSAPTEQTRKLSYDLEQHRALLRGLRAESTAREEIARQLNDELDAAKVTIHDLRQTLRERKAEAKELRAEKRQLNDERLAALRLHEQMLVDLGERDQQIEVFRDEIDAHRKDLESQHEELADLREQLGRSVEGNLPPALDKLLEFERAGFKRQLSAAERHTDALRQQLQDLIAASDERDTALSLRTLEASEATAKANELDEALTSSNDEVEALRMELERVACRHSSEIADLRDALSAAEDNVTAQQLINEQLAEDLIKTRNAKDQLGSALKAHEERSRSQIEQTERELEATQTRLQQIETQLETKNDSINCLLAELTNRRSGNEVGEMSDIVLEGADSSLSGTLENERVRRFLSGTVDRRDVQFPLFKNRVTIGRTQANDIQLPADYISRRHAVIVTDGEIARIIDWGSRNGIRVNGEVVTEHFLVSGDRVRIGTFDFVYEEKKRGDAP